MAARVLMQAYQVAVSFLHGLEKKFIAVFFPVERDAFFQQGLEHFQVPTLDGHAKIKIPQETQSGQVFRLRGKGIKGLRSASHGDLMCHVVVETPVRLTERQKELLRELDLINAQDARHNPRAKSWMDKVREFFAE